MVSFFPRWLLLQLCFGTLILISLGLGFFFGFTCSLIDLLLAFFCFRSVWTPTRSPSLIFLGIYLSCSPPPYQGMEAITNFFDFSSLILHFSFFYQPKTDQAQFHFFFLSLNNWFAFLPF